MNLRTNPNLYFHQALQILRGLPPFNKLKPQELLVYGELLLFNHTKQFLSEPIDLLDPQVRDTIVLRLNLSQPVFRNILTRLRYCGLLVKNNLVKRFTLQYLQPLSFEFIETNETEETIL